MRSVRCLSSSSRSLLNSWTGGFRASLVDACKIFTLIWFITCPAHWLAGWLWNLLEFACFSNADFAGDCGPIFVCLRAERLVLPEASVVGSRIAVLLGFMIVLVLRGAGIETSLYSFRESHWGHSLSTSNDGVASSACFYCCSKLL